MVFITHHSKKKVWSYKTLWRLSQPYPYCLPRTEELLNKLAWAAYISKLDMAKGFIKSCWEIKTRKKWHLCLLLLLMNTIWVKNSPSTLQRLVDELFGDLFHCTAVYIDDVAVFSTIWPQHLKDLESVLSILNRQDSLYARSIDGPYCLLCVPRSSTIRTHDHPN